MATTKLSDLQLDVMHVIWRAGEASTAQVHQAVQPERQLAYTTVATILKRLEERGAVRSARQGRELIYAASVTEKQVRRSMVANMVGALFQGDSKALVAHLIDEGAVQANDLEQIKALLEEDQ